MNKQTNRASSQPKRFLKTLSHNPLRRLLEALTGVSKKRLALIIAGGAFCAGCFLFLFFGAEPLPLKATFSAIYAGDLISSLTSKGTVKSAQQHNIYTPLSFLTEAVHVNVGDDVTAGQLLCTLDTADLRLNIAQLKAELDLARRSSQNVYENNKRLYEEAQENLSTDQNAQVISAQNTLDSAKTALDNAERTYNELNADYANGTDYTVRTAKTNLETAEKELADAIADHNAEKTAAVLAAQSALDAAKLDFESKESLYEDNQVLFESGVVSAYELTQSELLYENARNVYTEAQKNLDNAQTTQGRALTQLETAVETAATAYRNAVSTMYRSLEQAKTAYDGAKAAHENALAAYETAATTAAQNLDQYESTLENAEIALNQDTLLINIEKLEKQLADAQITTPAAGTVTAVYAKEGTVATGLLFVVEDTQRLQIASTVKEYDYTRITPGMSVMIRTDSTGDTAFEGLVREIAPAAMKNALGEPLSTADVEFAMAVEIVSQETPLRIGMNTRLEIILEKKEAVFALRYDAVTTGEDGESIVFAAEEAGLGRYRIIPVAVTTGMETDFSIEVSGEGLYEGVKIINDASAITDWMAAAGKTAGDVGGTVVTFI